MYPFYEVGWATGPVWTGTETVASTEIRSPGSAGQRVAIPTELPRPTTTRNIPTRLKFSAFDVITDNLQRRYIQKDNNNIIGARISYVTMGWTKEQSKIYSRHGKIFFLISLNFPERLGSIQPHSPRVTDVFAWWRFFQKPKHAASYRHWQKVTFWQTHGLRFLSIVAFLYQEIQQV